MGRVTRNMSLPHFMFLAMVGPYVCCYCAWVWVFVSHTPLQIMVSAWNKKAAKTAMRTASVVQAYTGSEDPIARAWANMNGPAY